MKLRDAEKILYDSLVAYCDDCVIKGSEEAKDIDEAWAEIQSLLVNVRAMRVAQKLSEESEVARMTAKEYEKRVDKILNGHINGKEQERNVVGN